MKVITAPGQDHYFSKDGFNLMTLVEEYLLYSKFFYHSDKKLTVPKNFKVHETVL
jgi:hypothetical protein